MRDGTFFDAGRTMSAPNSRAPGVLDRMAYHLGAWDVALTTVLTDSTSHTASCRAEVTYANKGFAFMERLYCADFDDQGHELNTLSFLTFAPAQQVWRYGIADSFKENIAVYDGAVEGDELILRTAVRRGGGAQVVYERLVYRQTDTDRFEITITTSRDHGQTWQPALNRVYTRRSDAGDFMADGQRGTYGEPAPERPDEARQFDFLIGTWDAAQALRLADGRMARFPSITTAIHAMNGHAILEHLWYDADPNFPDAATSVIRIYNRTMRRWESLFVDNRSSNPLFFGGTKEGDRIVLHLFEADASRPTYSYFIFHDIEPDRYSWHAEATSDRGRTFSTTWTIEATRTP